MKKQLLTLGVLTTIGLPIVSTISCGRSAPKRDWIVYTEGTKTLEFQNIITVDYPRNEDYPNYLYSSDRVIEDVLNSVDYKTVETVIFSGLILGLPAKYEVNFALIPDENGVIGKYKNMGEYFLKYKGSDFSPVTKVISNASITSALTTPFINAISAFDMVESSLAIDDETMKTNTVTTIAEVIEQYKLTGITEEEYAEALIANEASLKDLIIENFVFEDGDIKINFKHKDSEYIDFVAMLKINWYEEPVVEEPA